ncbi:MULTISPECIES: GNAT family N-acetyltransferase [Bacillus cereus group]|uniref:GNAT family N-acetyltransferase n=1 Tax=Bacillus cereus group TaxID=86661 RepID=UPI0006275BA6|nr:GNAT family N-acetyltransferase [Bacillus pacificus]KMQ27688.1 hypothetical protein TU53_25635 [Bacillus cereus]OBZ60081.1 hypothetical protein UN66_05220 [Bacillus cereus]OJE24524.1 hypothetical protein BAQ45_11485 [Bacillus pacificus]
MSQEINREMESLIRGWGLPKALKEQEDNIEYRFDDYGLANAEKKSPCKNGEARFHLYEKRNGKTLVSMEFYEISPETSVGALFNEKTMTLNLLYVDASFRKREIATHYIEKLKDYAISERIECIDVLANPDAKDFDGISKNNSLPKERLKKFYKKFENDKVKFTVF